MKNFLKNGKIKSKEIKIPIIFNGEDKILNNIANELIEQTVWEETSGLIYTTSKNRVKQIQDKYPEIQWTIVQTEKEALLLARKLQYAYIGALPENPKEFISELEDLQNRKAIQLTNPS